MNKDYPLDEFRQKIEASNKTLIVLPKNPSFDQVAAALSLSLVLKEAGKTATVVSSQPMTVEFNHLVGVDKISNKVQGTDLIVSFNYPADQIERVSYNDDGDRPNIVVQPKPGAPPLAENLAVFSYVGASADLVISVGLRDVNQLNFGGLDLSSSFLVNLDNNQNNSYFGSLNIVDLQASSVSEMILAVTLGLNLPLGVDAAQNLVSGIWQNTSGLNSSNVSADTYEAVAVCLRAGAEKPIESIITKKEEVFTPKKAAFNRPQENMVQENQPRQGERSKQQPDVKEEPKEEQKETPQKPPADWFEPKIFKGTSIS
jgi:nanoRNase/pAp phosphatase (c-di-AMP/oligoRNAs hydrolase)